MKFNVGFDPETTRIINLEHHIADVSWLLWSVCWFLVL